jgi:hypothetical protein
MNLSTFCSLALGALAVSASASAQSFSYPDFTSTAGLNLLATATNAYSPVLRVHDRATGGGTGGDNRGAAWYASPVEVVNGFDTTFEFNINDFAGSGDGMAFVIQNDQTAGYVGTGGAFDVPGTGSMGIGRHAAACGYGAFAASLPGESVDNSLAIEIDHYSNGAWGDLDDNHISIHTGGSGDNSTHEDQSIGRADNAALGFVNLNGGVTHTLRVKYVPGTMEVYFNGNLVLTSPYSFGTGGTYINGSGPVGGLNLIGGTHAYVGFTASSGGSTQNHDVISWSWDSGAGSVGTPFCDPATNNSTGGPAVLTGSVNAGVGSGMHLEMTGGVPGQLAYCLVGNEATSGLAISNGQLCLVGTPTAQLFRYNVAGSPMNSIGGFDGTGTMINTVGTSTTGFGFDIPTLVPATVPIAIMAGDTWHFQGWYRDTPAGVGTSNFTNGLSLTF